MSSIENLRWLGQNLQADAELEGVGQGSEGARYCFSGASEIESLRQQLAESQAREAKRITAMQAAWNNEYCSFGPEGLTEAQKQFSSALALPNDATALNELIAERTKELTAEVERLKVDFVRAINGGLEHQKKAGVIRQQNAELTAQLEALKNGGE